MGYPVKLIDLQYILKTTTYNNYNKAGETLTNIQCNIATCCEAVLSNSVKVSIHRNPGMHAYGTSQVTLNASPDKLFSSHKWLLLYIYFYEQCYEEV